MHSAFAWSSLVSSPVSLLTFHKPSLTAWGHWLSHQTHLSKENIASEVTETLKSPDYFLTPRSNWKSVLCSSVSHPLALAVSVLHSKRDPSPPPHPWENSRESTQAVLVIPYAIVYPLTEFFLPHCSVSAFPPFLSGTDPSSEDAERPFQEKSVLALPLPQFFTNYKNFKRSLQSVPQPRPVPNILTVLLLYQGHSGFEGALEPADPILSLLAR